MGEEQPKPAEEHKDSSSVIVVGMEESKDEDKEEPIDISGISDLAPRPSWFGPKR